MTDVANITPLSEAAIRSIPVDYRSIFLGSTTDPIELMRREFKQRADALGLKIDCMMDGDVYSEVAIVAEAPGDRESQTNMPLVGGSGKMLWNALNKARERNKTSTRISRTTAYVTNVSKKQLVNIKGKRTIPATEFQQWRALLHWELSQLPKLKYIIVLGDLALRALTGNSGITHWRGSVLPGSLTHVRYDPQQRQAEVATRVVTFLCTFNPAHILRTPMFEPVFMLDLNRFYRVLLGTFKPYDIDTSRINPTPTEAMQWIEKMRDEADTNPVSFDIETIANQTACIGLANDGHSGMCINFRGLSENRWSLWEEREVRKKLQAMFDDPRVRLIAQNGNYDSYWLLYKDAINPGPIWFDTMVAHHALLSVLPHDLGFLTTQYTTHPYYKGERDAWREGGDIDMLWRYNIKDVALTWRVAQSLQRELKAEGLENYFFNHAMRTLPHLSRMTVGGVLIDRELKNNIAKELRESVSDLRDRVEALARIATGDDSYALNPNSAPQLSVLFYRDLHLHSRTRDTAFVTRSRWIDDSTVPEETRELLIALNQYKTEHKFWSTYAEMQIDEDDRIRCEYKLTGTRKAPGRLSSSSVIWGSGGNLQNQPERAYDMFIADPGYCFVYFDLAQAEARVVACLAKIELWIEQFERARIDNSYDCHRALASEMFGIPYESVPSVDVNPDTGERTLRYVSKRCRHGLNYRMQAEKLAEVTGLPLHVARRAYLLYHRTTPELQRWWEATRQEVLQHKRLISPMGCMLRFLGRLDDDALDSIIAFRPQSAVGDKVKRVIYMSHEDPAWPYDARVAMNIHDALIALAPINKAKTCLQIMKRHAEEPMMVNGYPLVIPAECKMSTPDERGIHRWSTLKKIEIEL